MAPASLGDDTTATVTATMKPGKPEPHTLLQALATAHTHGTTTTWAQVFAPTNATPTPLPTTPFTHHHYWLPTTAATTDAGGLGQMPADHPLVGAAVELPEDGGVVLTGRVSVATHPWLADHAVDGRVLFPGTGFVELAVRGGDEVGCPVVEELTLAAPLVLDDGQSVFLQVAVGAADEDGRRTVAVHSRTDSRDWTRHASGTLADTADGARGTGADLTEWPPAGASEADVTDHYAALAARGYGYGPAFQGLKRAWVRGADVFAEVALGEQEAAQAGGYGLHPALLDAALHALGAVESQEDADGRVSLPFSWTGVRLHASAAGRLRVRLTSAEDGSVAIEAADSDGRPVASISALVMRELTDRAGAGAPGSASSLLRMDWVPLTDEIPARDGTFTVVGEAVDFGVAEALDRAGLRVRAVADLESAAAVEGVSTVVLPVPVPETGDDDVPGGVRRGLGGVLKAVQAWLADDRQADARLVVVTRGAVAAGRDDAAPGLVGAAVSGLVRSAQAESPGRVLLIDVDTAAESLAELPSLLGLADEPQVAVRGGEVLVPRLARTDAARDLVVPGDGAWRLDAEAKGSIDGLRLLEAPAADRALSAGEVRVDVRAAGVNFRDVLNALGMYPGEAGAMGVELAGVVREVGPKVTGLAPGDRVMGLSDEGAFGPRVVADPRMLTAIPEGWTFARAASVPSVFATAWYGLVDLAGVGEGDRVLVHSGAGGVGMAAIQIARSLGAEVFATASPGKWDVLRALGLADDHISSSRDLGFAEKFGAVDVVLNSLAGEFTDASLGLLGAGGRFIEMGKTDLRTPEQIGQTHPGVVYRSFDLMDAGPKRIGRMLGEVVGGFEKGALRPIPVRSWDVRRAPEAFRFMAQARHRGKIVLTIPRALDPEGTVLVTGGTGGLGTVLARHLVTERGVRHLVLASRRGPGAEGAAELVADLEAAGAAVEVVAADVSTREGVDRALAAVPGGHPLTGVFHTAGVVADGVLSSLDADAFDRVLAPKADAAWWLHRATAGMDLAAFALYSSSAGSLDSAGQGNYSAANAFLDALAAVRSAAGLPGLSLAWGVWDPEIGGMTRRLSDGDLGRLSRSGFTPLTARHGMELLDAAMAQAEPFVLPLPIDARALAARDEGVPAPLRGLVTPARRTVQAAAVPDTEKAAEASLEVRLASLPPAERRQVVVSLVRSEAAAVLGHASTDQVDPDRSLSDLGFDSLTSVELRNRLSRATGLRLPATLVFDYPTAAAIADYVAGQLLPAEESVEEQVAHGLDELRRLLDRVSADDEARSSITVRLQKFMEEWRGARPGKGEESSVRTAQADELFALIDEGL
ncbi:SDR family NAD(P)-dependent oxidoreductase [Nocardiopsis sediminis]|uniref:SDR family NAD(P)-dependent oxidoreductase n=1 Tax=Nocardiopsis sediminis TaxID=1778267 RepID=A0ABV8FMI9_9ACTN